MSAADNDPPGCPDFALCNAVTTFFLTSFAIFASCKFSIVTSFLKYENFICLNYTKFQNLIPVIN